MILPPYLRRAKSVRRFCPGFIKGISKIPDAPGLTASTIGRLIGDAFRIFGPTGLRRTMTNSVFW